MIRKIASAFYTTLKDTKTKPGASYADFSTILTSIRGMCEEKLLYVFVTDTGHVVGAVAYAIGSVWYSRATCLEEIFVLNLDPQFHGFGRVALKFLKNEAKRNGCGLMTTADALSDNQKMMENLYQRHGHCSFTYKNFVWAFSS